MSNEKNDVRCHFNNYVECSENKCGVCGWNPKISERRVKEIRADRHKLKK